MPMVKWTHDKSGKEYDVFAGDMNSARMLTAIEEKLKQPNMSLAVFDDVVAWIEFVLGDGKVKEILGKHYSLDDLMDLFRPLGLFIVEEFQKANEKYNVQNLAVPNEKPADRKPSRKK